MTPIGTWQDVARPAANDASDSGVTTPNSATPSAACTASDIDDLEAMLRQCEVPPPRPGDLVSVKDKLEVRVTPAAPRVAPGARIDVEIALKNRSDEPLALWFGGGFELEAQDAKGKRVDLPATRWPGKKAETREPRTAKIVLDRNGSAKLHLSWEAARTKWAPGKAWEGRGHPRAPAGPLPAGRYQLKPVLPLLGGDLEVPKANIEVGS